MGPGGGVPLTRTLVGEGPAIFAMLVAVGNASSVAVVSVLPADGVAVTDVPGREGTPAAARPVEVGGVASVDDGGGEVAPTRAKLHEHVPVADVPGGAPGKFGGVADGLEPAMVTCVGAPSMAGNGHSSTYGIAVPIVVPMLRSCGAPPNRRVPSAVSRIVTVSGIGWPSVVHCSVTGPR